VIRSTVSHRLSHVDRVEIRSAAWGMEALGLGS
jgi:hypothetical protein